MTRSSLPRDIIVAILLCLVLSSCGSESKLKVAGQGTPQECLAKWHRATVLGEWGAFRECFHEPDAEYEGAIRAMFDYSSAAMKLGREIEERFGAKTWDDFRKANGGMGLTPIVPPWQVGQEWSKSLSVVVKGDRAEVVLFPSRLPGGDVPEMMIQRDGQWLLDSDSMFKDPADAAGFFGDLRNRILKAIDACRQPGATLDTVKAAL